MRGVFFFLCSLVAVVLLSSARTDANDLQSNTSTSKCKSYPPTGIPGRPGTNGIPGIPGTPGSPSRDGFKGSKGAVGKRGLSGAIGTPGKIGPRGPEGSKGEKGECGTMGTKGSAGIQGNPGPRGLNGSKGKKGDKGEDGRVGAKGSSGIPGSTGIQGISGPRGTKGAKGESGIGTKGEKGNAANIDPRQLANWKQCAWNGVTDTNNGKIKECSFNKLHSNTALKVSYQGNIRVYNSNAACNRWYFKFNGNECSGPMTIDSVLYTQWAGGVSNILRPHSFEGYCENLAWGTVRVELWVGKCPIYTQGDAYTGWNSVSRIMIEEVPPSQ